MNFNFISPQNIYFGCGKSEIIPELTKNYDSPVLIVVSKSAAKSPVVQNIISNIQKIHETIIFDKVSGEPTIDTVNDCANIARESDASLIISIGGGSIIDTAKAAAGLAKNTGNIIDYLEGVGAGRQIATPPIGHIAVPTTSGTGSEMTKNAVISGTDTAFKRSFRHDKLVPVAAVVDPMLTLSVPKKITAYSGMDAITQLIESYISKKSNSFTDALSLEAMKNSGESLLSAYSNGDDINARTHMAYASMISGMCLANAGLGAVHGIAAGLGAVSKIPHGLACAVLLPHIIRMNAPHVKAKSAALCKALTGSCTGIHDRDISAVIDYIDKLIHSLQIPTSFKDFNIDYETAKEIIKSVSSSSMSGNPHTMTDDEIFSILLS